MIPPSGMALAAITVMLWIIWSDTIRQKRSSAILYAVLSAILILNMVRYPRLFDTTARILAVSAAILGLFGAAYFTRRLVRRL